MSKNFYKFEYNFSKLKKVLFSKSYLKSQSLTD